MNYTPELLRHYSVDQLMGELKKHQSACDELLQELALRANFEAHAEKQFNKLASAAKEGIDLLNQFKRGERVEQEWIEQRNWLITQLQPLIGEVPALAEKEVEP